MVLAICALYRMYRPHLYSASIHNLLDPIYPIFNNQPKSHYRAVCVHVYTKCIYSALSGCQWPVSCPHPSARVILVILPRVAW